MHGVSLQLYTVISELSVTNITLGYIRGRCACRMFGISSCDATSFDRVAVHVNWRVAEDRTDRPTPERRAAFSGTLLLALVAIVVHYAMLLVVDQCSRPRGRFVRCRQPIPLSLVEESNSGAKALIS